MLRVKLANEQRCEFCCGEAGPFISIDAHHFPVGGMKVTHVGTFCSACLGTVVEGVRCLNVLASLSEVRACGN